MSRTPSGRHVQPGSLFEQMCNSAAVSKTGDSRETIRGLVKLCITQSPEEPFTSGEELSEGIEVLLGVRISAGQIKPEVDWLVNNGELSRAPSSSRLQLDSEARTELLAKVGASEDLEARVKNEWLAQVSVSFPELSGDNMWTALCAYLHRAFRRHGAQTLALLDPTVETLPEYDKSLRALLSEALSAHVDAKLRAKAREAISAFLVTVGSSVDRARFVSQLADAVFNYHTLAVAPEVAAAFRKKLKELTLFLDTNFILGICDLHYNTHVDISHELMRAIGENELPFKLRYHEATLTELQGTISYYRNQLKSRRWTAGLSRAASRSRSLPGIEQRFHASNVDGRLDVDEFLRPFDHVDIVLRDKGIDIYRSASGWTERQNDLYHEYNKFLLDHGREKRYETVAHDAVILDEVRRQRSGAKSTLEAGAILLTCAYMLYLFDRKRSLAVGSPGCAVLPNTFWQILRPFIPYGEDFDRAFAETFALPEFRAIGSGKSKASSKMISLLATYRDVPEETAYEMLSNDALLDKLRATEGDERFREVVEAAFVERNAELLEEKAALMNELTRRETELSSTRSTSSTLQKEKISLQDQLDSLRGEVGSLQQQQEELKSSAEVQAKRAGDEAALRKKAEKHASTMKIIAASAIAVVSILVFEVIVHGLPWLWLRDHKNSLSLQICFGVALLLLSSGICVRKWRKWCLGSDGFALLLTALRLL